MNKLFLIISLEIVYGLGVYRSFLFLLKDNPVSSVTILIAFLTYAILPYLSFFCCCGIMLFGIASFLIPIEIMKEFPVDIFYACIIPFSLLEVGRRLGI